MHHLKKRIFAAASACLLGLSALTGCTGKTGTHSTLSAMEAVKDMGIGINLGNTFEACGDWINSSSVQNYETAWGSPVVTQEMIRGYADAGFSVLRVPVAWSNMMQDGYTIHPDYLARVHEVVSWALDTGMYVIMNIHWDGGWWEGFADAAQKDECMTKYTRIWEQLAKEFGSEGDKLVFESLNEEGCWNQIWNRYGGGTEEQKQQAFGLLNEINQTFVDLVRKSGGSNATRYLLIAGYATDIDMTCDAAFQMPTDAQERCIVSVHYYTPPTFCILEEDADWGKARTNWGSPRDIAELDGYMDKLKETFVDQGVPVIIGEYGCPRKNKDAASVQLFISSVCRAALERGMCPVLWDTTGGFYDRDNAKMYDETLHQQMLDARQEFAN